MVNSKSSYQSQQVNEKNYIEQEEYSQKYGSLIIWLFFAIT